MDDQIDERLFQLLMVLHYASEKTAMLKVGERICINQERAALMRLKEGTDTGFIQSETVMKKIDNILELMQKTNWQFKEEDYEY
jgi:uncharacterized protein with PIN domain